MISNFTSHQDDLTFSRDLICCQEIDMIISRYVLKKMECKDEAEANKAFKEAMALQELAHPYICGYRFVVIRFKVKIR